MLKPKTWNSNEFTLIEQIKSVKVNKICKVINQLPNEQVDIETLFGERLGSYL